MIAKVRSSQIAILLYLLHTFILQVRVEHTRPTTPTRTSQYQYHIERGSWSALLARCCLLAGYCGLVEKREEDAIFARCLGEELLMS